MHAVLLYVYAFNVLQVRPITTTSGVEGTLYTMSDGTLYIKETLYTPKWVLAPAQWVTLYRSLTVM